ncbi:SGNH/GDSL hydrolase family protein [Georgenia yuyongxinii]
MSQAPYLAADASATEDLVTGGELRPFLRRRAATVSRTAAARSPRGARSPALPAGVALVGLTAALGGVTGGQAVAARRRYRGFASTVGDIEVTVMPSHGSARGAAPIEMAAFGDSAMAGVGVRDVTEALPVQLAQRTADAAGRPVHVIGYARSGARTLDVSIKQVPMVRRVPDVSVLTVGTNDVTHLTSLPALVRSSRDLLDALLALGAPVVMSSLPEFRAMRAVPRPLRDVARARGGLVRLVQRAAAARPGVHLVDVCRMVGWEFVDGPGMMSDDSFHPSAAGYGRIADAMAPAVLSVLTTSDSSGGFR